MKGTLHKTESGWQVWYHAKDKLYHGSIRVRILPLHPDEPMLVDKRWEGQEVEFEIVDFPINSISKYAKLVDKATRPLAEDNALKTAMEQESKYSEKDIQNVLDGFTNEAPGQYIKTNFIGLLNKQY